MSTIDANNLNRALLLKGFVKKEGDHHYYYLLDSKGKKTSIRTKISHSHKEIGDPIINAIRKQLHFTKKEDLIKYSKCTLSKEDYYEILRLQGYDI